MNDFYVEIHGDCKLVIALYDGVALIDIFGQDKYHKIIACPREEVTSVKAELIYMYRRNRH